MAAKAIKNPFLRVNDHRDDSLGRKTIEIEVRSKDLGRAYLASKKAVTYSNSRSYSKWVGANDDACQQLTDKGDLAQVTAAEEFAKKVDKKLDIETTAPEMASTVAGGVFSVPAFRTGNPNCFRRPMPAKDTRKPIRLYVDIGVSCGIDTLTVQKRGRALLALAKILSKTRAVELVAFTYLNIGSKDYLIKVPLGLNNWAMAGAVLGNSAFLREPCFRYALEAAGRTELPHIKWGYEYRKGETVSHKLLGAKRNDVVFGRAHFDNKAFKADPVGWVATEIERINKLGKAQ